MKPHTRLLPQSTPGDAMKSRSALFVPIAFATALAASCESSAPRAPQPSSSAAESAIVADDYGALARSGDGTVYTVDAGKSRVLIYVFRGGAAAFAGHNHIVAATGFGGHAFVPNKGLDRARLDLEFPLDRLQVDDPELRRTTGGAFATALSADAIAGTREHMLGVRGLDAAHYPLLRAHAIAVVGERPKPIVRLALQLHGQTHTFLIPLTVELDSDALIARGSFALRQSDFGLVPYSVMNGLLAVRDEIAIDFTFAAFPEPAPSHD
jgi:hypothetical protein